MRKIIQIAYGGVANTPRTQCNDKVVALCDDGTVWVLHDTNTEWYRLPNIPKEK